MSQDANHRTNRSALSLFLFLLFICIALIAVFLILSNSSKPKNKSSNNTTLETLQEYFDSENKSGQYTTSGTNTDGVTIPSETGTFWLKGKKFKIEYSSARGPAVRSIISSGDTAYFCYENDKHCEPAIASVNSYLYLFHKPSENSKPIGRDAKNNCEKVQFIRKTVDDMKGSLHAWYNEDTTYCVANNKIVYLEERGGVYKGGSVGKLRTLRLTFGKVTLREQIEDSKFKVPYPIKNRR